VPGPPSSLFQRFQEIGEYLRSAADLGTAGVYTATALIVQTGTALPRRQDQTPSPLSPQQEGGVFWRLCRRGAVGSPDPCITGCREKERILSTPWFPRGRIFPKISLGRHLVPGFWGPLLAKPGSLFTGPALGENQAPREVWNGASPRFLGSLRNPGCPGPNRPPGAPWPNREERNFGPLNLFTNPGGGGQGGKFLGLPLERRQGMGTRC